MSNELEQDLLKRWNDVESLAELQDYLNYYNTLVRLGDYDQLELERYKNYKLDELPLFGGCSPIETEGIWSWDEFSLLVTDINGDFEIIDRQLWNPL